MAVRAIHDRLQRWRFELVRVASLGVVAPDPSVQVNVLQHLFSKLADENDKFRYRLNAFLMTKNLYGAATQEQA